MDALEKLGYYKETNFLYTMNDVSMEIMCGRVLKTISNRSVFLSQAEILALAEIIKGEKK